MALPQLDDEAAHRKVAIDRLGDFDREIVEFVIRWQPFGGPSDEDVFPEFGMSAARLWARCAEIAVMSRGRCYIDRDRSLLDLALLALKSRTDEFCASGFVSGAVRHWRTSVGRRRAESYGRLAVRT
ncbi:hypothetical protein FZI85_30075 [Mycobacterium sp. CBMA293]|uniref:hypothetical protein n=1 Tax=unclassified Mycolicibacterium TaxID=2636767 RepID=UPI0012DE57F2|nr:MULTISPECIES: hypothetical protein [unclassified Mycolicibacterium]MUL50100.1 hypothetical protein [Mycolicibacterium sp. CBMA 360]MUL62759.1 hypothetical protein [Mycolicibacterium sp. CBMA 335]MUL73207.1 hypothetical protein [Mycolicibacterium sp. CBMA 311]MUL97212.1 hypothetical protein [Mycolicibacterium sp. CBMA 230]MUM06684.1 hypothetical protein [Mycolicibacterium sp. CBMA 213]